MATKVVPQGRHVREKRRVGVWIQRQVQSCSAKYITVMLEVQEGIRFPVALDHDDERVDTQDKQVCAATNVESVITQGLEANNGPLFRNLFIYLFIYFTSQQLLPFGRWRSISL